MLAIGTCSLSVAQVPSDSPQPVPATKAIIAAFERVPIVAIADLHGLQQNHDFIASLVRDPDLPNKINDIVVEFGNAKYQAIIDRYTNGDNVPIAELRQVWRNTIGAGNNPSTDAPIYPRFFATVREVNRSLPAPRRLRVLLGDPPIDWSKVKDRKDIFFWGSQRDSHFAEVVEKQVLSKGRKALLIAGGYHLFHNPAPTPSDFFDNVVSLLERHHPGQVLVIMTHRGFGPRNGELEPRLSSWPNPGMALIRDTWLGLLDAQLVFPPSQIVMVGPDGKPAPNPLERVKLSDIVDAYLYLGPRGSLTISTPPPEVYQDKEYMQELERRSKLMGTPTVGGPAVEQRKP